MKRHTEKIGNKSNIGRRILLLGAMFAAIAVAVTCALCFGISSKRVGMDDVETAEPIASTAYTNSTGASLVGSLKAGDTIDYTYKSGIYSITLPRGQYTFEVWGASGGKSQHATFTTNLGGYTKATVNVTVDTQVFYIVVGGQGGSTPSYTGGYNGGGSGGKKSSDSAGGGGATHIAKASGTLRQLSSNRTSILLVAGGGGGNGCTNDKGGTGGGNNAAGTAGTVGSSYGAGGRAGTTTGAGSVSGMVGYAEAPGFGFGGSGNTTAYGCGGGGAGYWGGTCGNNKSGGGTSGGGGSGFWGNGATGGSGTTGGAPYGNGKAKITAVVVNRPPVALGVTKTVQKRGSTATTTIKASDIAKDPDGTATSVYFTNGTASALDSFSATANQGLYLDSACTVNAKTYFTYSWNANESFKVNSVLKYPRAGVNVCSTNGTLTVYAKVRDNYGTNQSIRGWAVIAFNIKVPANEIFERNTVVNATTNNNKLYIGRSNQTVAPSGNTSLSYIYNPLGTGRYTAIFEQPLRYDQPVTIRASDLVTGDMANGAFYSNDSVVVGINNTTAITGTGRKYQIDEFTNGTAVAAYNASRVRIANTYTQLSFRCLVPDPVYQVMSVTVYLLENTGVGGITYTEPNVTPNAGSVTQKTIDIVFKMDNTRPVLKDTSADSAVPVLTVGTLASTNINLSKYYEDEDASSGISNLTHAIKNVIVPSHEFIQLDKYNTIKSTANESGSRKGYSYFNAVANTGVSNMFDTAHDTGMLNGSDFLTGFSDWYISDGSQNLNNAFIRYSFSNDTLTVTGLRATYDMYKPSRTTYKAATGGNISNPTYDGGGKVLNPGHFYILINIQDKNDTSDNGIWLPLGIEVTNAAPTDLSTERGGAGASAMPMADGAPRESFYFTPMGITVNQVTSPIGFYLNPKTGAYEKDGLRPLAADADNFFNANMLNGNGIDTPSAETFGKLNELVQIVSDPSAVASSVHATDNTTLNDGGKYFTVDPLEVMIPVDYFGARVKTSALSNTAQKSITYKGKTYSCYAIAGLKITLVSWTHNRYLHATVNVQDTSKSKPVPVEIAVNVSNAVPTALSSSEVALLNYAKGGKKISSTYATPSDSAIPTITYNIPVNSTVLISPYDLLTDANMLNLGLSEKGGFTLNGLSGLFDASAHEFEVNAKTNDGRKSITALAAGNELTNGNYNYTSAGYDEALWHAISLLQTQYNFKDVSDSSVFGAHTTASTFADRLYFERKNDGSNLDGFTFNPYALDENGIAADKNNFVDPSIIGSSAISWTFGSSIKKSGISYNLDYLVVTALNRTSSPTEIDLNVRDRMGAGTAGGVKTIRVKINVVNSSPYVQYPDRYYTLTTDPVYTPDSVPPKDERNHTVVNANASISIKPSTLVITVGSDKEHPENNFLNDNEGDSAFFYTGGTIRVFRYDEKNEVKVSDEQGNAYATHYLKVSVTAQSLTITALNSTQAVEKLCVEFYVTDNRYNSDGELEIFPFTIQVEVLNAKLKVNKGGEGFEAKYQEDETTLIVDNLWNVESMSDDDVKQTRYFASGANAQQLLRDGSYTATEAVSKASSGQIKTLVTDTDSLQGVILAAALSPESPVDGRGYAVVDFSKCSTAAEYAAACKAAVPTIGSTIRSSNDIAVLLNLYKIGDGIVDHYGIFDSLETTPDSDIMYFVTNKSGVTHMYKASYLKSDEGSKVFENEETRKLFFDDNGRWIVTDWAVAITPKTSTSSNDFINLRISMRDETRFGGDTAGLKTSYLGGTDGATTVDGTSVFEYNLFINGMGIVPYTYYNQYDGYYTVTDAVAEDGNPAKVYVPTYDGNATSVYPTDTTFGNIYLSNDTIASTGTTPIKSISSGEIDNTHAGVHSGIEFDRESADYAKGYTYDVQQKTGTTIEDAEEKESAFRFTDTITLSGEVGADGNFVSTYIPMSYFGLRKSLVDVKADGTYEYYKYNYISYDAGMNNVYSRIDGYNYAVTINDGVNEWRGNKDGDLYALAMNPYVYITSFDQDAGTGTDVMDLVKNSPYYNKALSVPTLKTSGEAGNIVQNVNNFGYNNYNNLVGNGHLMYLSGQENLQENRFGLQLRKKDTRATSNSLTITIEIAECVYRQSGTTGTVVNYTTESKDKNTAKLVFKLEIGNSPISIVNSDSELKGAAYSDRYGYYTSLSMSISDPAHKIVLSRNKESISGMDRVITYADADTAKQYNSDKTYSVIEEKSDVAKFYVDSLGKLSTWNTGAKRTLEYTGDGTAYKFTNTTTENSRVNGKDVALGQLSMRNYFNAPASSDVPDVSSYIPNNGIFGTVNEGYSQYFSVEVSSDGSTLSIIPKAKTTINAEMSPNAAMYTERGLRYTADEGVYYPLKVIIYDDHGDGFMAGSYVALEIRVSISGDKSELVDSLDDYKEGNKVVGKKINVSLPVQQSYDLNVRYVLTGGNLLKKSAEDGGDIFWEADYIALKEKIAAATDAEKNTSDYLTDLFRLETGTYLLSPFRDGSGMGINTRNTELLAGNGGFSNNSLDAKTLPDVIMYMKYSNDDKSTTLKNSSAPVGNVISFAVNRRTTVTRNGSSSQVSEFTFKILLTDSDSVGKSTTPLYVIISVTNQAPFIRLGATETEIASKIEMRVGDSFTLVTTPYNRFVGSEETNPISSDYTKLSDSYKASTTYYKINQTPIAVINSLLIDRNDGSRYSRLTEANLTDADGEYMLHSYNPSIIESQHLGYLAIADDDVPWGLRIDSVNYYNDACFNLAVMRDQISMEGDLQGRGYGISTVITAQSACKNMPITITIADSDGARVSFTMYVTVVSSKPSPILTGDRAHTRNSALLPTYDDFSLEQPGIFDMYMLSNNEATTVQNTTVNGSSVVAYKSKKATLVNGGSEREITAYGQVRFAINQIAYDPDVDDNKHIALYVDEKKDDYDIFTLNDAPMSKSANGLSYYNNMFRIDLDATYTWFTLTCLTFNPNNDVDSLKFYIRDFGNNVFVNAIPIEIRLTTLYSSVTNVAQTTTGKVSGGRIGANTIDTVYVKPIDDYEGVSLYLQGEDNEEALKSKKGVNSTYQFIPYTDMEGNKNPAGIDQENSTAVGLVDPDVVSNSYNLDYEMRIYALMNPVGESVTEFSALSIDEMSALFDLSNTALSQRRWTLKDQAASEKYLVAGVYANGSTMVDINSALSMFIERYFIFGIGTDGASLSFRPVSRNIDFRIPFYVEVTKNVSNRNIVIKDVIVTCGTIFYVDVMDSAPMANDSEAALSFTGKVNDSVIFKIHDESDPFASMFTDSDLNDVVTVDGFTSSSDLQQDYKNALIEAIDENGKPYDWQSSTYKERAIKIEINNTDSEVNKIPAHALKITIVRRIDWVDKDGNYVDKVTLPVKIVGKDIGSQEATAMLYITIENSNVDLNPEKLAPVPVNNKEGYYQASKDPSGDRSYFLDAYLVPGRDMADFELVADGYILDPDYTSMREDTDSYRLVGPDGDSVGTYLGYGKTVTVDSKSGEHVATVTPIFGSKTMPEDEDHFAGFAIKSLTTNRDTTDAELKMRVIDRSGDPLKADNGFTITLRVHILNAPPVVKIAEDIKVIIGNNQKDGDPIAVNVADYVRDPNGDPVKIIGLSPVVSADGSPFHCVLEKDNTGELVDMVISDDQTMCTFTPRKGFYGTQTIEVMVADMFVGENGDLNMDYSVTTFRITFNIIYDVTSVTLKTVEAIRSLPVTLTPEMLFADISDTYGNDLLNSGNGPARSGVIPSAVGDNVFNPGENYVITGLTASGVKITRDGDDWIFVGDREIDEVLFNVTFKYKEDVDNEDAKIYPMTFKATIGKNSAPQLLDNFKNIGDEGFTFQTGGGSYGLDNNGRVVLSADKLFYDVDTRYGDVMLFDAKSTSVSSPTMCSVSISPDGSLLTITFNSSGECEITIGVKDRTNEIVKYSFKIKNFDRDEPSFWNKIVISYELYPIIWWCVIIGLIVLILLIILLIILLKRRKRKREELEAILISEMELEEQMMRLSASQTGATAPYQSFGFLPPTMPVQNDPNLMLGSGGTQTPTPGAIGLNPGQPSDKESQQ